MFYNFIQSSRIEKKYCLAGGSATFCPRQSNQKLKNSLETFEPVGAENFLQNLRIPDLLELSCLSLNYALVHNCQIIVVISNYFNINNAIFHNLFFPCSFIIQLNHFFPFFYCTKMKNLMTRCTRSWFFRLRS